VSRLFFGRSRRDQQDGAAAVEFALVLIPFITLLMGSIQYGWYFFSAQSASSAARETARMLSVGNCQVSGAAEGFAQRHANVNSLTLQYGEAVADPTNPTGITGANTLPDVGDVLRVVVRADGMIIGFLPMPHNGAITQVVDARVEDKIASGTC